MPLLAVFALGAALNIYGQHKANSQEARARRANAYAYEKQREMAQLASKRELSIFESESAAFIGDHISSFASHGVSLEGSALMQVAQNKAAVQREHSAIVMGAERQAELYSIAANQERTAAKNLTSGETFITQSLGSLLNAYTGYLGAGGAAGFTAGQEGNPVAGEKARIEGARTSGVARYTGNIASSKENPLFQGRTLTSSTWRKYPTSDGRA